MQMKRCTQCGYMGNDLTRCPVCRNVRMINTNSISKKQEAVKLLCQLLDHTPVGPTGELARQFVDLVMP